MKRRLTLLMIAVFVPVLLSVAYAMSEKSFSLSMEREQQRAQMTESFIAADVKKALDGLNYSALTEAARQYRKAYAAQGIELIFAYNGLPIGGAELPDGRYSELLNGSRCAMLDTLNAPQRYAIAEPITAKTTLLMLRDVSDLYALRDELRHTYALYAVLGAALVALLSYLIAWRFVRPVRSLTRATRRLDDTAADLPLARKDELGALARSFAQMQEAVRARENSLREEAANRQALLDALAHELRTPLCALLGDVRLLELDTFPPEKRAALLDEMAHEIKRLADMDAQLMKLTRLSHEPIERKPVAVLALLSQTANRLRAQADGVAIVVSGDGSTIDGGTSNGGTVDGDAELLSLLCDNLTVNALRASHAGQTVTLTALPDGFSVHDDGAGMTQEQLAHIFEPFYKADKARARKAGGAGLGLSLCKRIAELHGGSVAYVTAPSEGTTATFTTSLQPVADSVTSNAVSCVQEVDHP